MKRWAVVGLLCGCALALGGCVTLNDLNAASARLDQAWQIEYQQGEDDNLYRVVEADFITTFGVIRKVMGDLNLLLQAGPAPADMIIGQGVAPAPLSLDEWQEIARVENPRAREISGGYIYLPEDPGQHYTVIFRATLKALPERTLVVLDFRLDSPYWRSRGLRGTRYAPPLAVKLACAKFWLQIEKRLAEINAPAPRRRKPAELGA